jgi:hypothetical protein
VHFLNNEGRADLGEISLTALQSAASAPATGDEHSGDFAIAFESADTHFALSYESVGRWALSHSDPTLQGADHAGFPIE